MLRLLSNSYSKEDYICLLDLVMNACTEITYSCCKDCRSCNISRACDDMTRLYHHLDNMVRGDKGVRKRKK